MNKVMLIGLGNPGKKYAATRHNAGRIFAIWLKAKLQTVNRESLIVNRQAEIKAIETDCFMNSSGDWIYNFYKNYNNYKNYSRLLVAHDDLDLPLGEYKIQFGKGPHGHKGLNSIYQALGTKKFWHVRIGIDNRQLKVKSEKLKVVRESGEIYTLKPFSREEKKILEKVFAAIAR